MPRALRDFGGTCGMAVRVLTASLVMPRSRVTAITHDWTVCPPSRVLEGGKYTYTASAPRSMPLGCPGASIHELRHLGGIESEEARLGDERDAETLANARAHFGGERDELCGGGAAAVHDRKAVASGQAHAPACGSLGHARALDEPRSGELHPSLIGAIARHVLDLRDRLDALGAIGVDHGVEKERAGTASIGVVCVDHHR